MQVLPLFSGGGSPACRWGALFPGMLLAVPGQDRGWEPKLPPVQSGTCGPRAGAVLQD